MWIYFNNLGEVTTRITTDTTIMQGSVGVVQLNAFYEGANLSDYSDIRVIFKYSDNTYSPEVSMTKNVSVTFPSATDFTSNTGSFVSGDTYNCAVFSFDTSGYLGVAGETIATIRYYKNGVINVSGTINFVIESSVTAEPTQINETQYQALQLDIANRWKIFKGTYNTIVSLTDKDTNTLYVSTDTNLVYVYRNDTLIALSTQVSANTGTPSEKLTTITINGVTYNFADQIDLFKIVGTETTSAITITTSASAIINAYNNNKILLLNLTDSNGTYNYLLDSSKVGNTLTLTGYYEGFNATNEIDYTEYSVKISLVSSTIFSATKSNKIYSLVEPIDYNASNDLLGGLSFGRGEQGDIYRIPNKTSDLTNDSNYQNNTQVSATITAALNGYATQNWVGEQGYAKTTDLNNYILTSQKGIANGIASLDSSGLIPSNQLPSYVDDIIEGYYYQNQFYNDSEHTSLITPETGKIYVDLATNQQYRWGGTEYLEISSGAIGGVKGNAETTYRTGLVNLTPANIGSPTIADLTSETNTRIANEGKLYQLDFNGALSGTTITFTPTDTLPTLIENALYEIDLHLSLTSVLLDTYNIVLSINGTNVLINSILNGSTVGGLRQVEKYSNDTGYRWHFVAIYNLVNSAGYLTIPTSVNQESITRMSDENLLTAITNGVGIADKQVILISSVGNGNGYLLGHYYLISYNYSTNTYTTSDITPTYSYTLPIASTSTLGGIKVGNNLSIDSNGVLSATSSNTNFIINGTISNNTITFDSATNWSEVITAINNRQLIVFNDTANQLPDINLSISNYDSTSQEYTLGGSYLLNGTTKLNYNVVIVVNAGGGTGTYTSETMGGGTPSDLFQQTFNVNSSKWGSCYRGLNELIKDGDMATPSGSGYTFNYWTLNGVQVAFPVQVSSENTFVANITAAKVYGVDGIGLSATTLTRTDDGASFATLTAPSDIYNFFIDNADTTDSFGNHFVKIKKFYVKITQNSNGSQKWQVSNVQQTGYLLPRYFLDKDGNELNYAYYGKYKGYVNTSSGKLQSISGVKPTYNTTIDNYRTYARANSDNYIDSDMFAVFVAQCMFMITYATTKTDSIISYRSFGATTGSGSIYLGIEDLVGNGFELVDGCSWNASGIIYKSLISEYAGQVTSGTQITTSTGDGYAMQKTHNTDSNGYVVPESTTFAISAGGSATTYLCDWQSFGGSGSPLVLWGAGGADGGADDDRGLFCFMNDTWSGANSANASASRLHAKILS